MYGIKLIGFRYSRVFCRFNCTQTKSYAFIHSFKQTELGTYKHDGATYHLRPTLAIVMPLPNGAQRQGLATTRRRNVHKQLYGTDISVFTYFTFVFCFYFILFFVPLLASSALVRLWFNMIKKRSGSSSSSNNYKKKLTCHTKKSDSKIYFLLRFNFTIHRLLH